MTMERYIYKFCNSNQTNKIEYTGIKKGVSFVYLKSTISPSLVYKIKEMNLN